MAVEKFSPNRQWQIETLLQNITPCRRRMANGPTAVAWKKEERDLRISKKLVEKHCFSDLGLFKAIYPQHWIVSEAKSDTAKQGGPKVLVLGS
jgi:hypothetical protein